MKQTIKKFVVSVTECFPRLGQRNIQRKAPLDGGQIYISTNIAIDAIRCKYKPKSQGFLLTKHVLAQLSDSWNLLITKLLFVHCTRNLALHSWLQILLPKQAINSTQHRKCTQVVDLSQHVFSNSVSRTECKWFSFVCF